MSINSDEFSDIRPFSDGEAAVALAGIADVPLVSTISRMLYPDEAPDFLGNALKHISGIDEFQHHAIKRGVEWIIRNSMRDFSYDGIENLRKVNGRFVSMSNHRDIIVDPAIAQYILATNGFPTSQLCVGDNLLSNPFVATLLKANKMIKVVRGVSARSLLMASRHLSEYIRQTVTSGESSVWIAQREGRAKDGFDLTSQGLVKMLDMSGTGDFVSDFMELNIIPLSISYEYESCDILKAREILISRTQKYVKRENEDVESIVQGIRQWKGCVHLNIGEPLSRAEIEEAAGCVKNDRYTLIRRAVDRRIIKGYRLWKTNYMGYDLAEGTDKYASNYTAEELESFKAYIERQLDTVEPSLDRNELREILLGIYGNPVIARENLESGIQS